MPGKDREYINPTGSPEANKASQQTSGFDRGKGAHDNDVPHGEIMQKEDAKNKGSNKQGRDGKIGTEPGSKK